VKERIDIDGLQTCFYQRSSPEAKAHRTKFIITPGNPGAVEFYYEFVDALFKHLGGKYEVTVGRFRATYFILLIVDGVGHLGHGYDHQGQVFGLEEQITHKAAYLRAAIAGASFAVSAW
jgi:hypothetical protein